MAQLFKGNIINTTNFQESVFNLNIAHCGNKDYVLSDSSKRVFLHFKKYNDYDIDKVLKELITLTGSNYIDEVKYKYDELLKNILKMNADNVFGQSIIYEKIYDEEGNSYAKEIISGEIFPINSKYTNYDIIYDNSIDKEIIFDKDKGMWYTLFREDNYCYLIDSTGKKSLIDKYDYNDLAGSYDSSKEHRIYMSGQRLSLYIATYKNYIFKVTPKMIFPNNQRIEYVVAGEEIANEIEINKYLNQVDTGFMRKKKKKEFIQTIKKCSLSNNLGENIKFVSKEIVKTRISEGCITKEMEELEFILSKLKSVSPQEYQIIYDEYKSILNHDSNAGLTLNPLSIQSIITLQNKANLAYICHGGNSKRILEFIEKQSIIYFNNFKNGIKEKTELSIGELDKLCESFLYTKNSYSYSEQNEILRNLSLLYFFEIYENKDVLTGNDLINSYILDNIKRIITIISVLKDEGIIKEIPNTLFEVKNIDELLDLIQKIEFNKLEDISEKELSFVKKLQH